MDEKALEMLELTSNSCPQDVYNAIDRLKQTAKTVTRLKQEIQVYQQFLKLENSKTPLTDMAEFWDTHIENGDVWQMGSANLLALCKKLEGKLK